MESSGGGDDELGWEGCAEGLAGLIFLEGFAVRVAEKGHFKLQVCNHHLTLANVGAGNQ